MSDSFGEVLFEVRQEGKISKSTLCFYVFAFVFFFAVAWAFPTDVSFGKTLTGFRGEGRHDYMGIDFRGGMYKHDQSGNLFWAACIMQVFCVFALFKHLVFRPKKIILRLYKDGIFGLKHITQRDLILWEDIVSVEARAGNKKIDKENRKFTVTDFFFKASHYLIINVKNYELYFDDNYFNNIKNKRHFGSHITIKIPDNANYNAAFVAKICNEQKKLLALQ